MHDSELIEATAVRRRRARTASARAPGPTIHLATKMGNRGFTRHVVVGAPVQRKSDCGCGCGGSDSCARFEDPQPSGRAQAIQRYASCNPPRMSLRDCPPRQAGEKARARSGPMVFFNQLAVPDSGEAGVLAANFDIGSAAIKSSLHQSLHWKAFLGTVRSDRTKWKIVGFSDCQGKGNINDTLRDRRAQAVLAILPAPIKARITTAEGASLHDCLTGNTSAADRTMNRSVALILEESTHDFPAETIHDSFERKTPNSEGCSQAQLDLLSIAYPLAKRLGEKAIGLIGGMTRGSPEEALLKKFFGTDAFKWRHRIRQGYVSALRVFERSPTYKCVRQGTSPCESPTTSGYVGAHGFIFGNPTIVCEHAFAGSDLLELADTILHEASHLGDHTNDLDENCYPGGVCPTTDQLLPGIGYSDRGALNNAYSYAGFARAAFVQ